MSRSSFLLAICQAWLGIALAFGGAYRRGLLVKFLTKRPRLSKGLDAYASKRFRTGVAWMVAAGAVVFLRIPVLPVFTVYMWMSNIIGMYDKIAYGGFFTPDPDSREDGK